VILGLDAPNEGHALVGGHRYATLQYPLRRVGALVDAAAVQPSRTGRNHLRWLARSQRLPATRVDEVISLVGLSTAAGRKAGGYSLGMRQRLGIAAAMLGDPPVLILDEPFNGMDPEGIIWIRGFLRQLAAQGRAILVSSHLMGELEDTADRVVVLGRGRVLADASVADLVAQASRDEVQLRTPVPADAVNALRAVGAAPTVNRPRDYRGHRPHCRAGGGGPRRRRCRGLRGHRPAGHARGRLPDPDRHRRRVPVRHRWAGPAMTATTAPHPDPQPVQTPESRLWPAALAAEWLKFRTVRGWLVGLLVAAGLMLAFTFVVANGHQQGICTPPAAANLATRTCRPVPTVEPSPPATSTTRKPSPATARSPPASTR